MHSFSRRIGVVCRKMLMNTRAMTSDYRLQQWAGIIQKQKESGLNIKSFCEESGISEQRYYYWQRRLRGAANDELAKVQTELTGLAPAKNDTPVVWAEINMKTLNSTSTLENNSIKICRDGWAVVVEPGFDIGLLTEALRAVSRVCC